MYRLPHPTFHMYIMILLPHLLFCFHIFLHIMCVFIDVTCFLCIVNGNSNVFISTNVYDAFKQTKINLSGYYAYFSNISLISYLYMIILFAFVSTKLVVT